MSDKDNLITTCVICDQEMMKIETVHLSMPAKLHRIDKDILQREDVTISGSKETTPLNWYCEDHGTLSSRLGLTLLPNKASCRDEVVALEVENKRLSDKIESLKQRLSTAKEAGLTAVKLGKLAAKLAEERII